MEAGEILTGFWTTFNSEYDLLKEVYAAFNILLSDVYRKMHYTYLGLSLEECPDLDRYKYYYTLLGADYIDVDNYGVNVLDLRLYPLLNKIKYAEKIQNKINEPNIEWSREEDINLLTGSKVFFLYDPLLKADAAFSAIDKTKDYLVLLQTNNINAFKKLDIDKTKRVAWLNDVRIDNRFFFNLFGFYIEYLLGKYEYSDDFKNRVKGIWNYNVRSDTVLRVESILNIICSYDVFQDDTDAAFILDEVDTTSDPVLVKTASYTYEFPDGTPIRQLVQEAARKLNGVEQVAVPLDMEKYDPITSVFTLKDYINDPEWWYDHYIPENIVGGMSSFRRWANLWLHENRIGLPISKRAFKSNNGATTAYISQDTISIADFTEDFSVDFWFKIETLQNGRVLFSIGDSASGNGLEVYCNSTDELIVKLTSAGNDITHTYHMYANNINLWMNVFITWNGTTKTLITYLVKDNTELEADDDALTVLVKTSTIEAGVTNTIDLEKYNIGKSINSVLEGSYFKGVIDEFRLWNKVIEEADVLVLSLPEAVGFKPEQLDLNSTDNDDLLQWIRFERTGVDTTVELDYSKIYNHAVFNGTSMFVTTNLLSGLSFPEDEIYDGPFFGDPQKFFGWNPTLTKPPTNCLYSNINFFDYDIKPGDTVVIATEGSFTIQEVYPHEFLLETNVNISPEDKQNVTFTIAGILDDPVDGIVRRSPYTHNGFAYYMFFYVLKYNMFTILMTLPTVQQSKYVDSFIEFLHNVITEGRPKGCYYLESEEVFE